MIALGLMLPLSLLASSPVLGLTLAPDYRVDAVAFRFTHYDQAGVGYQSAAGPAGQPGSERAFIEQPQAEIVTHLGHRVTQRIWVPLDVITAASPDHSRYGRPVDAPPPDAVTTASRINVAGDFDALTSIRPDRATELTFRADFHLEEPFESWAFGLGANRAFADDNTVVGASVNQVIDWFDRFDLSGGRHGRASRSTSNLNLTTTQLLSPTTVAALSYGGTLQQGTLGNTWTSVLMSNGARSDERLPRHRQRHALAARLAQWLPWEGAAKLGYRAYVDGWGVWAHTIDTELGQRLGPWLRVRGHYRWHRQTAVRFFTTAALASDEFRTGDSDLDAFHAQTVGGAVALDLPVARASPWASAFRELHFDLGYEHYFRSNHLSVDVTSCGLGFRF